MPMQMGFRWYGEGNDKISLAVQAGIGLVILLRGILICKGIFLAIREDVLAAVGQYEIDLLGMDDK